MAAGDGLPELVTPMNTSEFEEIVRLYTAHKRALRGQLEVIAVDLRRLLPRAKNVGGRLPFGLDLKMAARQVAKQFINASATEEAGAVAAGRALSLFHGNFTATGGNHGGRTFDAGQ